MVSPDYFGPGDNSPSGSTDPWANPHEIVHYGIPHEAIPQLDFIYEASGYRPLLGDPKGLRRGWHSFDTRIDLGYLGPSYGWPGDPRKLWRLLWFRMLLSMRQMHCAYMDVLRGLGDWIEESQHEHSMWTTYRGLIGGKGSGENPARTTPRNDLFELRILRCWDCWSTHQKYWGVLRNPTYQVLRRDVHPTTGNTWYRGDSVPGPERGAGYMFTAYWVERPLAPALALHQMRLNAQSARFWKDQRPTLRHPLSRKDWRCWQWEDIFNRLPYPVESPGYLTQFYRPRVLYTRDVLRFRLCLAHCL